MMQTIKETNKPRNKQTIDPNIDPTFIPQSLRKAWTSLNSTIRRIQGTGVGNRSWPYQRAALGPGPVKEQETNQKKVLLCKTFDFCFQPEAEQFTLNSSARARIAMVFL